MKKVGILVFAAALLATTVFHSGLFAATNGDSNPHQTYTLATEGQTEEAPPDTLKSEVIVPSPSILLIIGSGLIGLIIFKKRNNGNKSSD